MPSFNNQLKISKVKKMVFIALLISMALVLSYFERFITLPMTFPGVKLGLANAVTLSALYIFNFRETFSLVTIRIIMNAIFVGNMISLWYSFSGILSFFIMFLLIKLFGDKISTIGVSVAGAFFHNVGQLIVVAFVTKSIGVAVSYLPVLSVAGVISGVMIGVAVKFLMPYLYKNVLKP